VLAEVEAGRQGGNQGEGVHRGGGSLQEGSQEGGASLGVAYPYPVGVDPCPGVAYRVVA